MAKKVRKLHVTVKPVRLDGLPAILGDETAGKNLSAMVEVKWKGPVSGFGLGFVPFYRSNRPVNHTSSKPIALGSNHVEWEEEFERVCCIVGPWNLSFNVFYGENMDAKNKKSLIGKASLDLSELASKQESTVERKLLIRSKGSVLSKEATLMVNVTFSEVRTEPDDFMQLGQISVDSAIPKKKSTSRRGGGSHFDSFSSPATASSSGGRSPVVETVLFSSPDENQSEPGQKAGFNWWKRRRLSFSMTWRREPREDEVTKTSTKPSEELEKPATEIPIEANKWVMKDLVSRDGKSKLKSEVYLASIDQRSEQAAGEAACAAVAVVVAHWFHANPKLINPSGTEFDSLITQGSSLWQSLCDKESYLRLFPNRHFDLETIVSANLRPVRVCTDKSFTGLFSPERFASLDGLMSFDQIWDEVEKEVALASSNGETRVYIVSWNDHFFVVKADLDGFCVIDSLGERLFEGCKQAYILKFDDSSLMYEKEESSEKLVCEGKKCCREYIKSFLAAIPVAELAAKEEKGNVVDVSLLHERLQIDLHHIILTSSD
ncbi:NT-type C2 domain [Arabidopsis thaliana x Arabidopsis arenosa]|nr:NT-type C2 domain [Arabidopsis thaliana x Arabidopsis arenosa]